MNKLIILFLGVFLMLNLVSANYGIGGGSSYGIGNTPVSGTSYSNLLNYSVSKSFGGVNTTTCSNSSSNSTLDFGDTVLIAKDYMTHSLYYTGDALSILSNVKADSKDLSINGIKQIDHSTIDIMASTRNGIVGQSVDKTLAVLLRANQQLIIKNTELDIEINRMKDCAKEIDYKTYSGCILK